MRTRSFALTWAFVLAVAAYDGFFAWHYRQEFRTWEVNPLARRLADCYGLASVFALKGAAVVFAAAVAACCQRRRHPLTGPYTLAVGGLHLLLSAVSLLVRLR
jgi:hypothetical protein